MEQAADGANALPVPGIVKKFNVARTSQVGIIRKRVMKKNIIIALVIFLNLILVSILIYIGLTWSPSSKTNPITDTPQNNSAAGGAQEFTFKAPGRIVGDDAPPIAGCGLTITATFDTKDQNGVIAAQGGLAHGYALYVQDGELLFAVRRANVLTTVSGGKISAGRHTATAALTKTGDISVALDGKTPSTGKAIGAITAQPVDGLDIGADRGAPVGPYEIPNSFGGTIESVTLKTAP